MRTFTIAIAALVVAALFIQLRIIDRRLARLEESLHHEVSGASAIGEDRGPPTPPAIPPPTAPDKVVPNSAGTREVPKPAPPSPAVPPQSAAATAVAPPPSLVPKSPRARRFVADNHIEDLWRRIVEINRQWLADLAAAPDKTPIVDQAARVREADLRAIMSAETLRNYLQFEKNAPGPRVQKRGKSGKVYEGVALE